MFYSSNKRYAIIGKHMTMTFNQKLGLRIRELRLSKRIKQGIFADMLNMERSNFTRIESGKQRPNDENLEKIASILNVELKELFDFKHIEMTKEDIIDKIVTLLSELEKDEVVYIYKSIINLKQIHK
uniref:HTH cro/C1-type domain-containing protein n=1 Tax=uncultured Candidatus Melainabacteria bacterium TaxID=2682970 RepID=A0A650EJW9_9BACT|nr:hypothetical protein Melaina855_1190 [uncultured Candidatus Melainabacteria bacterium]